MHSATRDHRSHAQPIQHMLSEQGWAHLLKSHKDRMRSVKSTINKDDKPWGCDRPRPPPKGAAKGGSRPSTARSRKEEPAAALHAAAAGRSPPREAAAASSPSGGNMPRVVRDMSVLEDLPPEDRLLCDEFVQLLLTMPTDRSRRVVELVFMAAEERRLLVAYSGVYPGLAVEPLDADGVDAAADGRPSGLYGSSGSAARGDAAATGASSTDEGGQSSDDEDDRTDTDSALPSPQQQQVAHQPPKLDAPPKHGDHAAAAAPAQQQQQVLLPPRDSAAADVAAQPVVAGEKSHHETSARPRPPAEEQQQPTSPTAVAPTLAGGKHPGDAAGSRGVQQQQSVVEDEYPDDYESDSSPIAAARHSGQR